MEEESSIIRLKVSTGHNIYTELQGLWTSGCIPCRSTSAAVIHAWLYQGTENRPGWIIHRPQNSGSMATWYTALPLSWRMLFSRWTLDKTLDPCSYKVAYNNKEKTIRGINIFCLIHFFHWDIEEDILVVKGDWPEKLCREELSGLVVMKGQKDEALFKALWK